MRKEKRLTGVKGSMKIMFNVDRCLCLDVVSDKKSNHFQIDLNKINLLMRAFIEDGKQLIVEDK
jgi:hypothetical protein